ncbi:hypothetical protein BpHYR1_024985 [Brachionus plicatilis]|uniref:Uncharacterized protein n=1 Tax=Brachionus plicatilis TaxID=10195 RepID=A0A3M7RV06_BRAPC|nr:hypothetical protein BpHYR1_024985 [Brachionus plicatilis]
MENPKTRSILFDLDGMEIGKLIQNQILLKTLKGSPFGVVAIRELKTFVFTTPLETETMIKLNFNSWFRDSLVLIIIVDKKALNTINTNLEKKMTAAWLE